MIAVKVTTKKSIDKVKRKAQQGNFKSLGHAAAAIRLIARRSIRRRKSAAMPGSPPNTRRGQLKRSLIASARIRPTSSRSPMKTSDGLWQVM